MKIAIIASNYPWPARPYCGAFVRELVWEFARQGHDCTVVCPATVWDKFRFGALGERFEQESVDHSSATVKVFRPRIVTASAIRLGPFNSIEISDLLFAQAVRQTLAPLKHDLDLLYAHFLYPGGRTAALLSRRWGIPFVVANGDFEIDAWYLERGPRHFRDVAGAIAVSRLTADFCEEKVRIPPSRVKVFPNGVDRRLFYPRPREEARRRLGLPLDRTLVAFVGRFDHGKGPDRLARALEGLPNTDAILIGEGHLRVESPQVAYQGVVDHRDVPWYLSAADIFALPTTGEGSCNAIIEALACGLPVVSSVGSFNDDILSPEVSIRVDPLDVGEIRNALEALITNPKRRQQMSENAARWAERFTIEERARSIAEWAASKSAEWLSRRQGCGYA